MGQIKINNCSCTENKISVETKRNLTVIRCSKCSKITLLEKEISSSKMENILSQILSNLNTMSNRIFGAENKIRHIHELIEEPGKIIITNKPLGTL